MRKLKNVQNYAKTSKKQFVTKSVDSEKMKYFFAKQHFAYNLIL